MKKKPFLLASVAALTGLAAPLSAQDDSKDAEAPAEAAAKEKDMLEAPDNVAAAPENAEKTESGLASIVLKEGKGELKPLAKDTVKVHYTGWTTDGKMFDSSVERGEPISFPLRGVIKGWTEGLQLMSVGEKRRFWIPADLAYGENPGGGRPGGQLTFDVELLDVEVAPEPPKPPADLTAPADAVTTESGLAYKVLTEGEGEAIVEDTVLKLHFSIFDKEGELVESSITRGNPVSLRPSDLSLPGWKEGVLLMKQGGKNLFWIPQSLTFGDTPPPGAPTGLLIMEVEVIEATAPPKPIEAPEDVAKAPETAEVTESGLKSVVLSAGEGDSPTAASTVEVHYTGWTTDGKMFDSSVVRGEPAVFPLSGVIKGWTEGVQLMKVGEKRRFWIPAELAYGETPQRPGAPAGELVFDIELISIK